jgi:hypothetical protein
MIAPFLNKTELLGETFFVEKRKNGDYMISII